MKLENPIYESDPYLADFKPDLDRRHEKMAKTISSIEGKKNGSIFKVGCVFPMYRDDDHREDVPHFIMDPYFWPTSKIWENYRNFKNPRALKHSQNLILNLDFIFAQTTQLLDLNGHHKESFQLIPRYLWYSVI